MTGFLLQVTDLGCEREGRRLFHRLNLSLRPGECMALTGPNGSGKSTLLRCITGLYPDFEGEIHAVGSSYLGHRPGVSPGLSVLENLRWYAVLTESGADAAELITRLDGVGLAGYEHVLCARLSAGQQRRVALARLGLDASPLWLLDEPFTALDTEGQDLVRGLIEGHRADGGAVLCATHQDLGVADAEVLDLGAGR
nr:cytochrome c-type biogenesis protein CcmA [uncultured bacterium]BAH90557.1 cytochrome c-type biogenesis protein CcmA [uncultured bacterium]